MTKLLIVFYTLIVGFGLLLSLPVLLLTIPWKELKQRLGFAKAGIQKVIWFHCASVGEVNALKPLLLRFREKYSAEKLLLTTMTTSGQNTARNIKEVDTVRLIPIDFLPVLALFFRKFRPQMIVIVETELWPALYHIAKTKSIPVAIVNGRISDRSFPKYRILSSAMKSLYKTIEFVGAQSNLDKQRFITLGFPQVFNTHNLKFSLQLPNYDPTKIRKEWHIGEEDFVLVWGSSRPGEEELLISIFTVLQKKIPGLKVIIAPRHLKRLEQVISILAKTSFTPLSELKKEYDILLIDSMNILNRAYSIADLAIVGGSFSDFGGHNPLEPEFYSVPTIVGNYYSSCRNLVRTLLENSAIIVSNKDTLLEDIIQLYNNKELRITLGKNGRKTIDENTTSVEDNLEHLQLVFEKQHKSS